ncbi:glutamyl aminopeptidase-like [Drosophila novamexicana]|uniref:glutamyl aminopeptidase-like n=1 Tax=Drosophila novamexicana TaxID=47314 RepID=UPI0011E5EC4B|nr:glutamyl aminopeptidase-like [Drosophila novamexicana]
MFLHGNCLRVALFWAVAAFAAATIVVAVQRNQLEADLRDMREKIDMYEALNGSQLAVDSNRQKRQTLEEIDYRLPTALEPQHYDLYLHPDLEAGTFTGQEKIKIKVLEATNQIVLHSHKLNITSVYVENRELESHELDEVREFLIINMQEQLPVDAVITLGIVFEGQSINKLVGLYSSSYTTPAGQLREIATTKFEPTYARQAFPCFDEPALKATYAISVVHPSSGSYHALSNMDQTETTNLGENTMATFQTSVAMSTYLACIIVSDFDSESSTVNANGIGNDFSMRAFATPHQLNKVKYALEFGTAVTEYYIQYFNVEYPLPKLDMAAIPDFASNAMEHWGLVTYRETALLYDEDYSSTLNKQSIAGVLAHEITHQWFGNLVTMKWWNDLWLNEGFARFMQYKGVHAVHPDWGMLEQFQIMALHPVLLFDAKLSSHPIVQKVESPDEITAIFDTISYEKAGSVLRMLESVVGADKFELAVTSYLTKFQYANTVTDDFLTEVAAQVSAFNVKQFMRTWTEQMGYPVLNVRRASETSFIISQQRFLSNKASYEEAVESTEFGYRWSVAITYFLDTSESNEVHSSLFEYDQDEADVPVTTDVKWLKLNSHQLGYYRVNYESSIWQQLIQELVEQPTRFDIADRAHLLDDAFALADASQLSYSVPLEMTAYLAQETDFVPWYVATSKLLTLRRNLMFTESYVSYLSYARTLLTNVYKEVGWTVDKDNHLGNRLRVSVLGAACALGVEDCLQQAEELFTKWLNEPTAANRPAPDLRELVYYYGMQQTSSEASWEQLLELFKAESDASEKSKLMYGLSAVQDSQLLYRFLELATDESIVRSQDYFTCVQNIAANPVGQPIVWDYYREQWPQLINRFGLNDRNLGKLITSITSRFASEIKLDEVQEFYTKYPDSGAGASSRQQAVETIKYNINWLKENSDDIASWLSGTAAPLTSKIPL